MVAIDWSCSAIPVVCRRCGRGEGFSQVGQVEVTVEVWRSATVNWDLSQNALTVKMGCVESEASGWDLDDAIADAALDRFYCSACGLGAKTLDELVSPKYGVDRWGRVLDEDGRPYGPMVVHPDQLTLEAA